MSMPKKGTRSIVVCDNRYRWRITYDPWYWHEKCARSLEAPVRIVVQAAEGGPCLVASFMSGPMHEIVALREPFRPAFVRKLIETGITSGWHPLSSDTKPLRLEHADVVAALLR